MNQYDLTTLKKKEAIIQVALQLFHQQGYSITKMEDIALQANVSKASIYNYFGSKEALVSECALVLMKEAIAKAEIILQTKAPFIDKLLQVMAICNTDEHSSMNAFLSQEIVKDTPLITLLNKNINILKKNIYLKYIEEGQRQGDIDKDISRPVLEAFIDSINNLPLLVDNQELVLHQEEYIHIFLYGLLGKK
jgi:AcrR family transcriptional regulator